MQDMLVSFTGYSPVWFLVPSPFARSIYSLNSCAAHEGPVARADKSSFIACYETSNQMQLESLR